MSQKLPAVRLLARSATFEPPVAVFAVPLHRFEAKSNLKMIELRIYHTYVDASTAGSTRVEFIAGTRIN